MLKHSISIVLMSSKIQVLYVIVVMWCNIVDWLSIFNHVIWQYAKVLMVLVLIVIFSIMSGYVNNNWSYSFDTNTFSTANIRKHTSWKAEFLRAKSTDRDKLTAKRQFCYRDFVTDFVAVILSQSEGLGKMALGIVEIYLGSPFSANQHCPRSVCSRSVVVDPNFFAKDKGAKGF